jgi:hypothetical protein
MNQQTFSIPFFIKASCLLLLLLMALQTNFPAFAQTTSFPVKEWAKKLNSKDDLENTTLHEISTELTEKFDDSAAVALLQQLEKAGETGPYITTRLSFLKSVVIGKRKGDIASLVNNYEKSLYKAFETGDNNLIAYLCFVYGLSMEARGELSLSTYYYLRADEICDIYKEKPHYLRYYYATVGENLYRTSEYEKCIFYTKKELANYKDTSWETSYYRIRYENTIGQAYKQLGQLDSAMTWYQLSMHRAQKLDDPIWIVINAVLIGEVWLLKKDYRQAKTFIQNINKIKYTDEPKVCAYGLQLLAKMDLIYGAKDSALHHIKQSLQLLNNSTDNLVQKMDYLQYAYHTAADVYRAYGNTDSFYHYSQLYATLHDSLQKVITLSSIKIAQLRINNEKNFQTLQQLKQQRENEALTRNFIIAILIMLSLIAILILNRQRQKATYKEQLALQQKEVAEANMAVADAEKNAAMEQMNQFTRNLIEKTSLIEKLEQQLKANARNIDQQNMVEELTQLTILTEDDWLKFKTLFEKTYPGFFKKLKLQASDITQAEQRMAALTRLMFDNKQIASVLGISAESVAKGKRRLRQRLQLAPEINLEGWLQDI